MKYIKPRLALAAIALVGVFWSASAAAVDINLYVGQIKVLNTGPVERVAVGNGKLLSTSIVENHQLLLLAEKKGRTDLYIWYKDGHQQKMTLDIGPKDTHAQLKSVQSLLQNEPGLSARRVGKNIVIEGNMEADAKPIVAAIASKYSDVINLAKPAKVGNQKMVYMSVKITEFSTNALQELGVNWKQRINGPSAGFATEFQNGRQISSIQTSNLDPISAQTAYHSFGYFGIATQISSMIDFAVQDGEALILAEPTLTARSGGKAKFLAGGQIPLETTSVNGQTNIEYKDFGTKLNISPIADDSGRVVADVKVEISSLDRSIAVGNVPGFRTRRTSTSVVLDQDQTLVISGLTKSELSNSTDKIAGLGDIPIIGALFRHNTEQDSRRELVIFVTPHIVDESSKINQEKIQRSKELIRKYKKASGNKNILLQ